nr:MAG TPA: hypothetical protein [Caudoviricetes sp.]
MHLSIFKFVTYSLETGEKQKLGHEKHILS